MEEEEEEGFAAVEEEEEVEEEQEAEEDEEEEEDLHDTQAVLRNIPALSIGAEKGQLRGHMTPVIGISFAPSANLIVTGGDDETIRVFDADNFTCLRSIASGPWLTSPIRAIAVAPDASRLIVAARENAARVMPFGLDRELSRGGVGGLLVLTHDHWVRAVCANWRRNILATASNDSSVRLWNLETGAPVRRFTGIGCAVSVSMNDRIVVAGFHDTTARGFFIDDDQAPSLEFFGHSGWVVAVSLGERRLITGSQDNTCRVFDLETQECLALLRGHVHSVVTVAISPCETRGLSGSNDGSVIYWSFFNGGEPLLKIENEFGSVRSCLFLRTGHDVCFSTWDNLVHVYDLHHDDNQRILALCYASNQRLGSASDVKVIVLRDILSRIRKFLLKTNTMMSHQGRQM